LGLNETEVNRHTNDLREIISQRWFAARKLHRKRWNRAFFAQRCQHVCELLESRLIDVTLCVGISKTPFTAQVAPVGDIHVCETRRREMGIAEATFEWAWVVKRQLRVLYPFSSVRKALGFVVHLGAGPVQLVELAMLRTSLNHPHLAVLLVDGSFNGLQAFMA
jgi:hypothetical protein